MAALPPSRFAGRFSSRPEADSTVEWNEVPVRARAGARGPSYSRYQSERPHGDEPPYSCVPTGPASGQGTSTKSPAFFYWADVGVEPWRLCRHPASREGSVRGRRPTAPGDNRLYALTPASLRVRLPFAWGPYREASLRKSKASQQHPAQSAREIGSRQPLPVPSRLPPTPRMRSIFRRVVMGGSLTETSMAVMRQVPRIPVA